MEIAIDTIVVGERRREDFGDLASLVTSIQEHGLIQPIVIDSRNRLVAGMRRLAACKLLEWTEIDVRQYGELTDQELRILELEENLRRKDLSAYEQAKEMVAYVEAVWEQIQDEVDLLSDSDNKSKRRRGRPKEVDTQKKVAERAGVSQPPVSNAETHVAIADTFPFMQSWPQYRVLEAKEYVEQLPEAEYESLNKLLNQPGIPADSCLKILRNFLKKTPEERTEIYACNDSTDPHERSRALTMAANTPSVPDPRLPLIRDAIKELKKCVKLSKGDLREPFMEDLNRIRSREQALK